MSAASRSFVKGAAILAISAIICRILGAVYRIPLSNLIGQEGMGNYQMVYPVYMLLLVLSSSGLPVAISKLVSEKRAKGDAEGAMNVFRVSFASLVVIGIILSVSLFFAGDLLSKLFGLSTAALSFKIVAPSILFVSVTSAYRGYFQGMQKMTPTAVSQVIEQLAKLAAGLGFARAWMPWGPEFGAAGAIMGVTVSEASGLLIMFVCYRAQQNKLRIQKHPSPYKEFKKTLEQICRIALPVTVGACVVPMVSAIDSMVVMRVLTSSGYSEASASSLFGLLNGFVHPVISLPSVLSVAVATSLVPAISAARAQNRRELVNYQTTFGFRLAILLGLPCAVGFFILAEPILRLLYGSLSGEQLARAVELLKLMCPGVFFLAIIQISTGILQGLGRTVVPVVNMLFGAAIKVCIGIALIRIPSVNINGAAIGTMVCFGLAAMLDIAAVFSYSDIKWHLGDMALRPIAAVAGMATGVWLLFRYLSGLLGSNKAVLIAVLAGIVIYVILLLLVKAVRREDMRYLPGGGRFSMMMEKIGIWR